MHLVKFRNVNISGDDGVIITRKSSDCAMYVPGGDITNLAHNIRLEEVWTTETPPPEYFPFKHLSKKDDARPATVRIQTLSDAASVIGFAPTDFYHSLIELGSRLLLLSDFLQNRTDVAILVPSNKPIPTILKLLKIKNSIYVYPRSQSTATRFIVDTLHVAHWDSCDLTVDGCLSTPPAEVLQKLQASLLDAQHSLHSPKERMAPSRDRILYLRRTQKLGTRYMVNEEEVLKRFPGAEQFDPSTVNLGETMRTMQTAKMVIGVHGGALANILFCQPNTTIVEFGWPAAPHLGHFRHISRALSLDWHTIPVEDTPQGSAAKNISVNLEKLDEFLAVDRFGEKDEL